MTQATTVPGVRVTFKSQGALRDLLTRTPVEFLVLERRVYAMASQESDTFFS